MKKKIIFQIIIINIRNNINIGGAFVKLGTEAKLKSDTKTLNFNQKAGKLEFVSRIQKHPKADIRSQIKQNFAQIYWTVQLLQL